MADIKVNKQAWDALTDQDRDGIQNDLRTAGAMDATDSIVGDPAVEPFSEADLPTADGPMPGGLHCRIRSRYALVQRDSASRRTCCLLRCCDGRLCGMSPELPMTPVQLHVRRKRSLHVGDA